MIPIKNIYHMLAYAFKVLNNQGYKSVETESFNNVAELCSAILYRGISSLIKQGLSRDYLIQTEELSALKGKIDYSESMKRNSIMRGKMVCSYDEFSVNSYLNRILKTTMLFLLKSDISSLRKKELRRIIIFFDDVNQIEINQIDWNIRFTKNNQIYQMLIAICNLVLKGLLQTQSDGSTKLMDFLDEQHMHRLYEKFLLEFYRKERKDLTASAMQIPWMLDDEYDSMLPVMQTDITLTKDNKTFIIDAKYYSRSTQGQYNSNTLHSSNLYQIFTYVKNRTEQMKKYDGEVTGMLLYARTTENVVPNNNVYSMSGNKVIVHSLDLNRDFEDIKNELNDIVNKWIYN